MDLKEALKKIGDLELEKLDLEQKVDDLEEQLEESWIPVSDGDMQDLEERVFLRDIGFDPDNLPKSLGERMDIRSRLESPIPNLADKLEECQEQYKYIEEHYNRAWELGYDPITREFYCRACIRAGRED